MIELLKLDQGIPVVVVDNCNPYALDSVSVETLERGRSIMGDPIYQVPTHRAVDTISAAVIR